MIFFINQKYARLQNVSEYAILHEILLKVLETVLLTIKSLENQDNDLFDILHQIKFSVLIDITNRHLKPLKRNELLSNIKFTNDNSIFTRILNHELLDRYKNISDSTKEITKFVVDNINQNINIEIKNNTNKIVSGDQSLEISIDIDIISKYINKLQKIILFLQDFLSLTQNKDNIPNNLVEKILDFELQIVCINKITQGINIQNTETMNERLKRINCFVGNLNAIEFNDPVSLIDQIFNIVLIEKKFLVTSKKLLINTQLHVLFQTLERNELNGNIMSKVLYEKVRDIFNIIYDQDKHKKIIEENKRTFVDEIIYKLNWIACRTELPNSELQKKVHDLLTGDKSVNGYGGKIIDLKDLNVKCIIFQEIFKQNFVEMIWEIQNFQDDSIKNKFRQYIFYCPENTFYIGQNLDLNDRFSFAEIKKEAVRKAYDDPHEPFIFDIDIAIQEGMMNMEKLFDQPKNEFQNSDIRVPSLKKQKVS